MSADGFDFGFHMARQTRISGEALRQANARARPCRLEQSLDATRVGSLPVDPDVDAAHASVDLVKTLS